MELVPDPRKWYVVGDCNASAFGIMLRTITSLAMHELDPTVRINPNTSYPGRRDWASEFEAGNETGLRLGNYRLDGLIGEGGMGRVYAATDLRDGREVAIKRVRPHLATPNLLRRLGREFELMQRVQHPGIVRPLALETDADGLPYLVLERVHGVSLDRIVGEQPVRERVAWIAQAARLAGVAHACGIVHRDIKPSNLMIGEDGTVHLLDFGIAKPLFDEAMTTLTQTGEQMLTPRFAAPEQFLGTSVGPAADVFALGTVLLDCVVGLDETLPGAAVSNTREQRWLNAIIAKARNPDAAQRYRDGQALAEDLDRWLAGRRPRAAAWWRDTRWSLAGGIAIAIVVVVATGVAIGQWRAQQYAVPIDAGLGLVEGDLADLPADVAASVRLALAADANGDRPRAENLMQAASEVVSHPVPLLYLVTWSGDATRAQRLARLDAVLAARPDPYFSLLRDWLGSEEGTPRHTQDVLRAALDLRPHAWKLRLAMAHQALLLGDDEGARRELAEIDANVLDSKRAAIVLGDRAMLGDSGEVESLLPALAARDSLAAETVSAIVQFANGRCESVVAAGDDTIDRAIADHRPDLAARFARTMILCLGEMRKWSELREQARRAQRDFALDQTRIDPDLAIFAAIAAVRMGEEAEAMRLLDAADREPLAASLRLDLALARRMLGLPDDRLPQWSKPETSPFPDLAHVELFRAFVAYGDGRIDAARQALAASRREGIHESLFAMHADWLAWRLGETDARPNRTPMLWYPPTSRWATRW